MTNDDARELHDIFVREARARMPRLVPRDWSEPARTEEHEDSWVFVYREAGPDDPDAYEAVIVRKDGSGSYILLGAIGKTFRSVGNELGWPRSNERWLGSEPGRYQAFDEGLVVWHEQPGLAYGRRVPVDLMTGRRCISLVACGIDVGELNQVFLFGQSDYLGEAINTAAHLQQLAWNEVIISTRYADRLIESDEGGRALLRRGVALANRGIRIDPSLCS